MAKNLKKDAITEIPNPFGDLTKTLEQFKVPGVDMSSIIDARRKDIEALVEANKAAYEAMQALGRKQADMLTQAMQGIQEAAKELASGGVGVADPTKQAEVARKVCQKVLVDMKDLAEMACKAQTDVVASMTQRATQNMQEIKRMVLPK